MNVNNSTSFNLISIVGYGIFITRNLWKDKANVEVCFVKNFTRIYPKGNWFPYALRSNGSFKALKFDVNKQELETLDIIEGVSERLFERVTTDIYLKNKMKSSAFITTSILSPFNILRFNSGFKSKQAFDAFIPKIQVPFFVR